MNMSRRGRVRLVCGGGIHLGRLLGEGCEQLPMVNDEGSPQLDLVIDIAIAALALCSFCIQIDRLPQWESEKRFVSSRQAICDLLRGTGRSATLLRAFFRAQYLTNLNLVNPVKWGVRLTDIRP